ncbi:MAG: HPP family protein [Deltaproteobacteria bacterium]|nr:HPP family protein [Deltaproteobacteria bacterium]
MLRIFKPILAGATLRERLIACVGALLGIWVTSMVCGRIASPGSYLPLIVAPMGASAVLLFAVPASPLAQPWPIIGGNTISALVGLGVGYLVDEPALAAGLAVSLAILVMSFTRCLHPPGGAAALTAVLGGPTVEAWGVLFALVPVALNSAVIVALGVTFHRLAGRAYPHHPPPPVINPHGTLDPPAQLRAGFRPEDVDAALRTLHETFDVGRDDVARLLQEVELQAAFRSSGQLKCSDIMSRDIIKVGPTDAVESVRSLLMAHKLRVVPVIGASGQLIGTVGLRELIGAEGEIEPWISKAATASAEDPAVGLIPALSKGSSHAVVIVDGERQVQGLITQTDLLAALMPTLARGVV